ncbi:MAG TPA: GNAT family N-acetyltransferase [Thermomicrobiaceae bacterium]|nr:GNAT family N-acetyltransferase [Thermomicrobiaceae bacterium]
MAQSPLLRPAREDDLADIFDVWFTHETADDHVAPPRRAVPPWYRHELRTGTLWVAEASGRVVAFAGAVSRDGVDYLADLFVRPAYQSAGLGRQLLREVMPATARVRCTLASRDFRALGLYTRAGMQPAWPNVWLAVGPGELRVENLPGVEVEVREAAPGDPEFLSWDAEVSGRSRAVDHDYWLSALRGAPLMFEWHGHVIGYGYVSGHSPGALWHPETVTLGPIGARTPTDALGCVGAAVRWAGRAAVRLSIPVPGSHPALGPLLDAGFQITYVETFCSSAREAIFDPRCYVPSGEFL